MAVAILAKSRDLNIKVSHRLFCKEYLVDSPEDTIDFDNINIWTQEYYLKSYDPATKALYKRSKLIDSKASGEENPVFGEYYQISAGTGSFQLHNTHIDILASYGVIVFLLVCVFLMRLIHNKNKIYKDKTSFLCMLGFASTIFLGLGEAAVFSGGLAIYMWCGLFLILKNRLFKE